ncbi:MAG: hypothetical protein LBU89_04775 [Fibromonadaceae bacterium]|jgi:antitoxin component YwqK of YwqJK toxin-antitoxin module|nr:hypothetical protein [Fibromonadaceae bacterium]
MTFKKILLIGIIVTLANCKPNRLEVVEVFDNNAPKTAYEVSATGEKEKFYSWYRTGIKAEEISLKQGAPHGVYRKWSTNGFIIERGTYKDSLREGRWTFFAKEKMPYMQGNYKGGKKDGKWLLFDEKGKVSGEQFFRNDSAVGTWKKFHNDILIEENSCHPANESGYFRSHSNEGKILIYQECRYGKLNGIFMSYYPGGALRKVGRFESDLRNGLWVEYFASGKLWKIENWISNIRNGKWARFSESGDALAKTEFIDGNGTFEDTTWQNNRIHGELRIQLRNGEYLRIETYDNGVKQSTADYPKNSARPVSLGFWQNGKKDGAWRTWYRSGVLRDSLNFNSGKLFGEQFYYDSTGRLYKKETVFGENVPKIVEMVR